METEKISLITQIKILQGKTNYICISLEWHKNIRFCEHTVGTFEPTIPGNSDSNPTFSYGIREEIMLSYQKIFCIIRAK